MIAAQRRKGMKMRININEIKIKEGRRAATPEAIDAMTASIREVGMMNPITVIPLSPVCTA